jgi:hypothetical protein
MLLIVMLYIICGISVVLVMIMLFMDFDYYIFTIFEYYTIIFFLMVNNIRSSYERGSANTFIMFFRFVLGFGVVINNNLDVIGFLLLILGLAKLPMYRLHI